MVIIATLDIGRRIYLGRLFRIDFFERFEVASERGMKIEILVGGDVFRKLFFAVHLFEGIFKMSGSLFVHNDIISLCEVYVKKNIPCFEKKLETYNIDVYRFLKHHSNPRIPRIYDFREEDGSLFVKEELIQGKTLQDYLLENNPDRKEKCRIIRGICDGLIFLHSAKPPIIHRDLKPSNIMVSDDGVVYIIDYDAARRFKSGDKKGTDTEYLGTRGYAAPEQYGFGQSDARTDIYALGKMIEEMFPEDNPMQEIARVATEIDPRNRFIDVREMKHILKYAEKADPSDSILPDELYEDEYNYCPNCGAVLDDQKGFSENDGTWICSECGMQLYGDEAGETGNYKTGVIWYCDKCGAILNKQEGFDYYGERWICKECGFENDISENNIENTAMKY